MVIFFSPSEKGQLSSKEVKIILITQNKKELPLPEISNGSELETWVLWGQHCLVTLKASKPECEGTHLMAFFVTDKPNLVSHTVCGIFTFN